MYPDWRGFEPKRVGENQCGGKLPVMHIRSLADLANYDALSIPDRRTTYKDVMSGDDRKRMVELRAFLGFVKASGLPIDPSSAVCLDPPCPDIDCRLSSSRYFFELGEVTDEGLAQRYNESLRTGKITGGAYSQDEPLKSMITSKARKMYQTGGVPVDLVLYYWKQAPYYPAIQQALTELSHVLTSGPFSRIWLYQHPEKVLAVVSRRAVTERA